LLNLQLNKVTKIESYVQDTQLRGVEY